MTEFQELTQDAPNFVSMGRGELVAYAYGMFAAGTKTNAENAKLRELVKDMWPFAKAGSARTCPNRECCLFEECDAHSERECPIEERMAARMRELGIEVPNGN